MGEGIFEEGVDSVELAQVTETKKRVGLRCRGWKWGFSGASM